MQKGLFSSLPSIGNWPAKVDLAIASAWAGRNGLGDPDDFQALLALDDAPILWASGGGVLADDVTEGDEDAPPLLAALAGALPAPVCLLFARSASARALTALTDPVIPPICADSATLHGRQSVDDTLSGRPLEAEGTRLSSLLTPGIELLLLSNQGVIARGTTVAESVFALHRFERAAATYLAALSTGRPLRTIAADRLPARPSEAEAEAFFQRLKTDSEDA